MYIWVHFKNVKWDATKEEIIECGLDKRFIAHIEVNENIVNDEEELTEFLSDWLSDEFGFCHKGFDYEVEED